MDGEQSRRCLQAHLVDDKRTRPKELNDSSKIVRVAWITASGLRFALTTFSLAVRFVWHYPHAWDYAAIIPSMLSR